MYTSLPCWLHTCTLKLIALSRNSIRSTQVWPGEPRSIIGETCAKCASNNTKAAKTCWPSICSNVYITLKLIALSLNSIWSTQVRSGEPRSIIGLTCMTKWSNSPMEKLYNLWVPWPPGSYCLCCLVLIIVSMAKRGSMVDSKSHLVI